LDNKDLLTILPFSSFCAIAFFDGATIFSFAYISQRMQAFSLLASLETAIIERLE